MGAMGFTGRASSRPWGAPTTLRRQRQFEWLHWPGLGKQFGRQVCAARALLRGVSPVIVGRRQEAFTRCRCHPELTDGAG